MLNSYFKIAWRNIRKKGLYSFINIIGLATGLTACLLIGLYIWNEWSYDRFHKNASRIGRVTMEYSSGGTVQQVAVTGTKIGPLMLRTFPQVQAYVRLIESNRSLANGPTVFDEKKVLYADKDFFTVFSFPLLQGDVHTALEAPESIVLTRSAARKYFGSEDPLGKTLRMSGTTDYRVTGVVADPPLNSQIDFNVIASFSSLSVSKREEWWSANYITYVLTKRPGQLEALQKQLTNYMREQVPKDELHMQGSDYLTYNLEPLTRVHLYSKLDGITPNGNITYVYIMAIIALLIMLIACVNYTNLATAQSTGRSTEIGIRKVMGAGKMELFRQFIGESFLMSFLALVLALGACFLLMPVFNSITGKSFGISQVFSPAMLLLSLLLVIVVGFTAGSYPALVLSNTGLATILKSGVRITNSGGGLRKSLIVFQFVVSVFLLVATLVVVRQLGYIRHKDLGYDKNQVIVLPVDFKTRSIYPELKSALEMDPGVVSVSGAYEDPTSINWGDGITANNGKEQKNLGVNAIPVDLDFIKTMGMHLVAGSDFTKADFALQDTSDNYAHFRYSYILNEKAVRDLGWTPAQAIGQTVSKGTPGIVKGVIHDFNFASLHEPIGPLVMFLDTSLVRQLFIKINSANVGGTLAALDRTWKERVPHRPFDYHFLDEDFEHLYQAEQRTASLFTMFSSIAVALACLGLFALAAYATVQRTREIGIRKILGAGVGDIALLLVREFLVLVLISVVIAVPLAWMAGDRWLQDFAYRIRMSWWMFAAAGTLALLIALITVGYHGIRAALSNPVKTLRNE